MDKERTRQQAKKAQEILDNLLQDLLKEFCEGNLKEIISSVYGLKMDYRTLRELMCEIGMEEQDETFETEGWENDYWETYLYNEKAVCLWGSMASGKFHIQWQKYSSA